MLTLIKTIISAREGLMIKNVKTERNKRGKNVKTERNQEGWGEKKQVPHPLWARHFCCIVVLYGYGRTVNDTHMMLRKCDSALL